MRLPLQWTKFNDSPTSTVSSPSMKPVNFDFSTASVEQVACSFCASCCSGAINHRGGWQAMETAIEHLSGASRLWTRPLNQNVHENSAGCCPPSDSLFSLTRTAPALASIPKKANKFSLAHCFLHGFPSSCVSNMFVTVSVCHSLAAARRLN